VRAIRDLESGRVRVPRQVSVRLLADVFGLQGQERENFVRQAHAGSKKSPEAASGGERTLAPAQLPLAVPGFAGRTTPLGALDAAASVGVRSRPVTVVISAVSGTAGVGKTALAIHWAHRVRNRFPDGQLYVNLRGFDPGGAVMPPAEAVRLFLDALEVPAERIPADLDAQAALYRSLLAGRRMLVVLDNARDAEQVRPLLPGAPGCVVVVTSRSQLSGLVADAGAHPLTLDLLTRPESRQLLAARLGPERLAAEPDAVEEIVTSCARLPLALAIVAARAPPTRTFRHSSRTSRCCAHESYRAGGMYGCRTSVMVTFSGANLSLPPRSVPAKQSFISSGLSFAVIASREHHGIDR
jgi:hypothetical protein